MLCLIWTNKRIKISNVYSIPLHSLSQYWWDTNPSKQYSLLGKLLTTKAPATDVTRRNTPSGIFPIGMLFRR